MTANAPWRCTAVTGRLCVLVLPMKMNPISTRVAAFLRASHIPSKQPLSPVECKGLWGKNGSESSPKTSPRVDAVDGPGIEVEASAVSCLYLHAGREGEHAYAVARDVRDFLARVQVSAVKNAKSTTS